MARKAAIKKAPAKRGKRGAALREYQAKRDFNRTAEPAPKQARPRKAGLVFVVQKHDARRLHFDLRLELDGVLKSWAVTRGPSMKPGIRRLAVETEDHPMAYKDWEGVIPKGEYGGGTMIVWDTGTWEPIGDARKGLSTGKLSFRLSGERLKGEWTLVRMKEEGKRKNWLLIKRTDEHALEKDAVELTETVQHSARSGRTNADLAAASVLRPDHKARAKSQTTVTQANLLKLKGAKKGILPPFVEPSLAMSVAEPPAGKHWIHEIKHDGYRIIARLDGGKAALLTRKGLDWSKRFPTIVEALKGLPVKAALIDGEIIVQDEHGHASFSGLQSDLKAGRHDRMVYYVFDLMHLNGVDLRGASLADRKQTLQDVLAGGPQQFALRFNDHLAEAVEDILSHACRLGLEGIISKQAGLPYVSGRGDHWVKSKCMLRQEFVIAGFLPATDIKNAVGSLVLGYHRDGKLVHAGRAGTGFSAEDQKTLYRLLSQLEASKSPFGEALPRAASKNVRWLEPERVAEIEYRGRTADGLLRQAAFAGMREDKPASEVVLEQQPEFIPQHAPTPRAAPTGFTHPERLLWPEAGITKQALGDYYAAVAEWIMPHVKGRVLSLVRCPDGADAQCFYAKHAWMGLDGRIKLVDAGGEKPMMSVDDIQGILALVQMNVLEIHVWGSTIKDLERPDRLVFDLDPGEGVSWDAMREAAVELRERLLKMKLQSFLKTSGGKGLHVTVPVKPEMPWDVAKAFCKRVAEEMAGDSPARYLASMSKSRRKGRIFIDYLRNGRGATAIAPYSTRAREGAPVAMPLGWDELPHVPSAAYFTVSTAPQRLVALKDDPWADISRLRQRIKV